MYEIFILNNKKFVKEVETVLRAEGLKFYDIVYYANNKSFKQLKYFLKSSKKKIEHNKKIVLRLKKDSGLNVEEITLTCYNGDNLYTSILYLLNHN